MSGGVGNLQVPFKHSSSATDGYADDIQSEADAYFHRMFSSHCSIQDMIKMLARFKESSNKREKLIFDCMLNTIFEEYKFFSKYPNRQLRMVALLFGFLVKHQLVTHIPLGMTLRAVFDALCQPADSEMFLFGTLALEQFVERMSEWPRLCNCISQIPHLRANHPELANSVKHALDKITAGHSEPNVPQSEASPSTMS